jgi:hypothetical protein
MLISQSVPIVWLLKRFHPSGLNPVNSAAEQNSTVMAGEEDMSIMMVKIDKS